MIDAKQNHNTDPQYLRKLLADANISQLGAARLIGVAPRAMRYYLSSDGPRCPYAIQVCLEILAKEHTCIQR